MASLSKAESPNSADPSPAQTYPGAVGIYIAIAVILMALAVVLGIAIKNRITRERNNMAEENAQADIELAAGPAGITPAAGNHLNQGDAGVRLATTADRLAGAGLAK
jgi:hypothetical protein